MGKQCFAGASIAAIFLDASNVSRSDQGKVSLIVIRKTRAFAIYIYIYILNQSCTPLFIQIHGTPFTNFRDEQQLSFQ